MAKTGSNAWTISGVLVGALALGGGVVYGAGGYSSRIERVEADVATKAPQKEVDALADEVKEANRRLERIMVHLGIVP